MILWFASGNAHKKQELAAILSAAGCGYPLKTPLEAGIAFDPDETGDSFLENALLKARVLSRLLADAGQTGPVIADDSGLCVDALGGRPGIYSARYGAEAGSKLGDAARNALLLGELENARQRSARFVCAMVLLYTENRFFAAQETLEGEIIPLEAGAGQGRGGFGFDPILYLPGRGLTVAELPAEEKNCLSHRGKAARALVRFLG